MGSVSSRGTEERDFDGFDSQGFNKTGQHSLHAAVRKNDLMQVKSHLRRGVSPNLRTLNDGVTPLILAASWGRPEILEYLLKKRADVHLVDNQQWTALHAAVWNGHLKIVDILLNHAADVEAKDEKGLSPMDWGDKRTDEPRLVALMRAFTFFQMCAKHEADLWLPRPLLGIIAQYAFGVTGRSQVELAFERGTPEIVDLWHDKSPPRSKQRETSARTRSRWIMNHP